MKWIALVRGADGCINHCSLHKTHEEASDALVKYRRETGVGFGTTFIIAEIRWAIEE